MRGGVAPKQLNEKQFARIKELAAKVGLADYPDLLNPKEIKARMKKLETEVKSLGRILAIQAPKPRAKKAIGA